MFIGHYGPAFGAKAALRAIPLWVLFVAVQFMDVVWSIFVLSGIENVRIVPGFTQASSLDLYYMPYTHGLFGALALSVVFGGRGALHARAAPRRLLRRRGRRVFALDSRPARAQAGSVGL